MEVSVNITVLNYTVCLAGLGLVMCVLQYLTLNKFETVVICNGESAEGKVCDIYHSPTPIGLNTLDRVAGIQTGYFLSAVRLSS